MHRILNSVILILGVLAIPFTHGVLGNCGVIVAALMLVAINNTIAARKRGSQPPVGGALREVASSAVTLWITVAVYPGASDR